MIDQLIKEIEAKIDRVKYYNELADVDFLNELIASLKEIKRRIEMI